MKRKLLIFLFLITAVFSLSAQNANRPAAYNRIVFLDNIRLGSLSEWRNDNIPNVLREYYSLFVDFSNRTMQTNNIAELYQERNNFLDTESNKLFYISKGVGDGYLAVNKKLDEWLIESGGNNGFEINYYIDENEVVSEKQIRKLIRLREKKISSITINPREQTIAVEITLL